ncbi:MAG: hypothetical protein L3K16_05260 [Thermoplasmata archaeon]|nr:hypothetical protein [Thermoplasmata archaeon]
MLVKNGTDWSIPSHAFEARWFSVGEESELEGSYSSIGAVRIYLLNSTGFVSYVGGNFTTGSLPANSSPTESQIAWSSGTTTGGGYVDTFAGGQNYDLLVCAEDGGSSVHFEFTSAFVASVADVA